MIPVEGILRSCRHVQKGGPHSIHCVEALTASRSFPASGQQQEVMSKSQFPKPLRTMGTGSVERVIHHVKELTACAAGKYFLVKLGKWEITNKSHN